MTFVVPRLSVKSDWPEQDRRFMERALELAQRAESEGEVPVGALVVREGAVIGAGWNRPIAACDPTSHAETEAIREAALHTANYRLLSSTLYVTLEPCIMCVGAILNARLARLVFAARDLRFGAVRSKFQLADSDLLSHKCRVEEGLFAVESATLLQDFFKSRRLAGESFVV